MCIHPFKRLFYKTVHKNLIQLLWIITITTFGTQVQVPAHIYTYVCTYVYAYTTHTHTHNYGSFGWLYRAAADVLSWFQTYPILIIINLTIYQNVVGKLNFIKIAHRRTHTHIWSEPMTPIKYGHICWRLQFPTCCLLMLYTSLSLAHSLPQLHGWKQNIYPVLVFNWKRKFPLPWLCRTRYSSTQFHPFHPLDEQMSFHVLKPQLSW